MSVQDEIRKLQIDAYRDQSANYMLDINEYELTPVPILRRRIPYLTNKHGISPSKYLSLLERQNGRCKICGDSPPNLQALDIDHCHERNIFRGLICGNCNSAIGMIKNDPETARAIADYLEKFEDENPIAGDVP